MILFSKSKLVVNNPRWSRNFWSLTQKPRRFKVAKRLLIIGGVTFCVSYVGTKFKQVADLIPTFDLKSFDHSREFLRKSLLDLNVRENLETIKNRLMITTEANGIRENENTEEVESEQKRIIEDYQAKLQKLQESLFQIQTKYQKEVKKLEDENKDLRHQLILKKTKNNDKRQKRRSNKLLIDMYSETLDELARFASEQETSPGRRNSLELTDCLPRVVVVGDQSSGKTSVLEMIARARIFPRGSGEMMTRSPVKVTLSEGPYHVARFAGSSTEYDLTNEQQTALLRKEVEDRMKAGLGDGRTVTCECVSLSIEGPGLQRMVLIDLPGIISTVTSEMASDTRDSIKTICQTYIGNPNAIILCIQDGSLDAERSNVTDLVSQADPHGRRTIFVLTKTDVAEANAFNPHRIRQILQGKLFPMKALGYFAVVTGRGNAEDSVETIRQYEEEYFANSKFYKMGFIETSQITTANLSFAVSQCFWRMVQSSVLQQYDAIKAVRYNLETEWRNNFGKQREMDRQTVFEKTKNDILDDFSKICQLSSGHWEKLISEALSGHVLSDLLERILALKTNESSDKQTLTDIELRKWAEGNLSGQTIDVGLSVLHSVMSHTFLEGSAEEDSLRNYIVQQVIRRHDWDSKADNALKIMQLNALDDLSINEKHEWDSALLLMNSYLTRRLGDLKMAVSYIRGPSVIRSWLTWTKITPERKLASATMDELEKIVKRNKNLTHDDVITIRGNLENRGFTNVSDEKVKEYWNVLNQLWVVESAIKRSQDCSNAFFHYKNGFLDDEIDCSDVVLFGRIQRILRQTSHSLRLQITNNEVRRLENVAEDVLSELGDDVGKLESLLSCRKICLAEQLKRVRYLQGLLEEFIEKLKTDSV